MRTTEISICVDCMVLLANGETPDDDFRCDSSVTLLSLVEGQEVVPGGDHNADCTPVVREALGCQCGDLGFCTTACDGCGSVMHGDRFKATIFEPPEPCPMTGKVDCKDRECELHYMDAPLKLAPWLKLAHEGW